MKFSRHLILLVFSYFIPWTYALLSQFWTEHGGVSSTLNYFEFPLILCLCLILYFNAEKNDRILSKHIFTPALTILGTYTLYDIVYSYLGRSPRLSDCKNIPSLYSVSPLMFFSFIAFTIVIFSPVLFSFFSWINKRDKTKSGVILLIKLLALLTLTTILFSESTYNYQKKHLHFTDWTNTENVRKNGRAASFIYYYNKRKNILTKLENNKHIDILNHFYPRKPTRKKNIHIVILESFVDPRKIKHISYNRSPLSDNLSPFLLDHAQFSTVISPVYGGGTSQAEFEILTGIPALALIDSIEFNLFEGSKTSSLINILKQNGYHTIASIGTRPVFYNSQLAYGGIGFDEIYFLEDTSYFKKSPRDNHIFDGDLLEANISYIEKYLSQEKNNRPLVNYVLGMYGHIPFDRNKEVRPDIILAQEQTKQLTDLSNQFYYRTEALAQFIQKLKKLDPDSIILVLSDHLPPIFNSKTTNYNHNLKTNIALLLNDFTPLDVSDKKHYEVSHILWNLLNETPEPLNTNNVFGDTSEKEFYYSYILEAMGLVIPEKQ